jgi:hypothetical protein
MFGSQWAKSTGAWITAQDGAGAGGSGGGSHVQGGRTLRMMRFTSRCASTTQQRASSIDTQ